MAKRSISLFLAALIFASCTANRPSPMPSIPPLSPTITTQAHIITPTASPAPANTPPTPTFTPLPSTPAASPTTANPPPLDQPLIAYESADSPDHRLVLLDPSGGTSWEFSFPAGSTFATPFLKGLSPDAHYFVYYEGGRVGEYGQFIAELPTLAMHIYDLRQRAIIFSTPLLSPEFPQDLKPLVEMTEE